MELFPRGPLRIKQGTAGDCFLLVWFECLFNSGPAGQEILKSMFDVDSQGRLRVKLPQNKYSQFLNSSTFKDKYSYEQRGGKDIFTIDPAILEEIANSAESSEHKEGVRTNSLALAVLERIVPYYFKFQWDKRARRGSLGAYDKASLKRHAGASSEDFLSNIFSIPYEMLSLDQVRKFKTLYPDQPVYLTQEWLVNNKTVSHVWVLNKMPSQDQFELINPWDNQKVEEHHLAKIEANNLEFYIFVTEPRRHQERIDIIGNTELYKLLCGLKSDSIEPTYFLTKGLYALYKVIPYLHELFAILTLPNQHLACQYIAGPPMGKHAFLEYVLRNFVSTEIIDLIIKYESSCLVNFENSFARIALQQNNQQLFEQLLERRFNFPLFIYNSYPHGFEDNVDAILLLENSRISIGSRANLKRIECYLFYFEHYFRDLQKDKRGMFLDLQLKEQLKIVHQYVKQIKTLSVFYDDCYSMDQLNKRYGWLLDTVQDIARQIDLREVYQSASESMLVEYHAVITDAIRDKHVEIGAEKLRREGILQENRQRDVSQKRGGFCRFWYPSRDAKGSFEAGRGYDSQVVPK